MARPIEATPTLYGEDAQRLLDSLENCCSHEEAQRRSEWADRELAKLGLPRHLPNLKNPPR